MSYLKRAWLSVYRRKGKSLILLIVVFILGNLIAGTFAITQASNRVEVNLKSKLGYNASIGPDWDKIWEDYDFDANTYVEPEIPEISSELIKKVGSLPEVDFYDYSKEISLATKSLSAVAYDSDYVESEDEESYFTLHGIEYLGVLDSEVGRIELSEGRVFNEDDLNGDIIPVIVSDDLLSKNSLRMDEVVTIKSMPIYVMSSDDADLIEYKFKVIGSFKPITFGKSTDGNYNLIQMLNRIYLPNMSLQTIIVNDIKASEALGIEIEGDSYLENLVKDNYTDSVFVTKSQRDLESFIEQASSMIEDRLIINSSQDAFDMVAGSISMLKTVSQTMLKASILVSVLVLSLVIVLFLRDRKKEMGIYIAIGDHKWKILSQITLEVLMITIIGLTLSFSSGLVLADKASDALSYNYYEGDVFIDTSSSYIPAVNLSEVDEDYKIKMTPSFILITYAIGSGVAIASSLVPMLYVTRMKPKKILM